MNPLRKFFYLGISFTLISGCETLPKYPETTSHSDKYEISIKYNAENMSPTLTEKATEMARNHCGSLGKEILYISGTQPSDRFYDILEEIHRFRCISKKPVIDFESENGISILHDNESYGSTANAEVLDLAIKHCNKHEKGMKLLSSSNVKESTENMHTFICTNDFTDQRIELDIK
jgi:hypothetical protein